MAILYLIDEQGGFLCGDTLTGITEYAYPTSDHATAAKRDPEGVARTMLAKAWRPPETFQPLATELQERDRRRIARLKASAITAA